MLMIMSIKDTFAESVRPRDSGYHAGIISEIISRLSLHC